MVMKWIGSALTAFGDGLAWAQQARWIRDTHEFLAGIKVHKNQKKNKKRIISTTTPRASHLLSGSFGCVPAQLFVGTCGGKLPIRVMQGAAVRQLGSTVRQLL